MILNRACVVANRFWQPAVSAVLCDCGPTAPSEYLSAVPASAVLVLTAVYLFRLWSTQFYAVLKSQPQQPVSISKQFDLSVVRSCGLACCF